MGAWHLQSKATTAGAAREEIERLRARSRVERRERPLPFRGRRIDVETDRRDIALQERRDANVGDHEALAQSLSEQCELLLVDLGRSVDVDVIVLDAGDDRDVVRTDPT